MPSELAGGGTATAARRLQQVTAPERKPDYFIGGSGRPVLASPSSVKMMHRSSGAGGAAGDGVRNSKLNKCLYNLAIRNGAGGSGATAGGYRSGSTSPAGHGSIIDGNSSSSRRSCKIESDIMAIKPTATTGRNGKSPSSPMGTLSSVSACPPRFGNNVRGPSSTVDPGRTAGSSAFTSTSWLSRSSSSSNTTTSSPSFGLASISGSRILQKTGHARGGQQTDRTSSNRSSTSPPPRLLTTRSSMQRTSTTTTTTRSNRPHEGGLMVAQQCRYSNHHKQLDNRLSYQRSYDRNIFGYDQRMDQLVLPPLQI